MLAKSRTESEMSRMKFESTSRTKMNARPSPVDARRDQALQVADEALGADALDVVAEPDDERQHERDRDVRRRRVERERSGPARRRCRTCLGVRSAAGCSRSGSRTR